MCICKAKGKCTECAESENNKKGIHAGILGRLVVLAGIRNIGTPIRNPPYPVHLVGSYRVILGPTGPAYKFPRVLRARTGENPPKRSPRGWGKGFFDPRGGRRSPNRGRRNVVRFQFWIF